MSDVDCCTDDTLPGVTLTYVCVMAMGSDVGVIPYILWMSEARETDSTQQACTPMVAA